TAGTLPMRIDRLSLPPLAFLFAMAAALAALKLAPESAADQAKASPRIDFARDVQPIFAKHCISCHGPKKSRSGLRPDRKADAMKGGDSGRVIVPGKSGDSLLVHLVTGKDDSFMPPDPPRLAPAQVATLRAWIDQGANWPDDPTSSPARMHWAFVAPVRPALPAVRNAGWPRTPLDHFVLARLEKEGLAPSPEADRVTLFRRLHLDLVGLPPLPADVDAFVRDQSPGAYERAVE